MHVVSSISIPAASDASVTQNGVATPTSLVIAVSAQAKLTGSPVGTLTFQASNDIVTGNQLPTNWTTVASTSVAVSAAGTYLIPKIDCCYSFVRVVYTATSGTGTVTSNIAALGL